MTVLITLTSYGSDTGPFFDLYSNADGYAVAFEQGVSKNDLVAGYSSALVPNAATSIRIQSTGVCDNYIDIALETTTTTSTTTAIPLYTYYITNGVAEGCGDAVGTTEYFAYEAAPNAVTAFSTSNVVWNTYSPGAGTLGWSLSIGPVNLADFEGTIDENGVITVVGSC